MYAKTSSTMRPYLATGRRMFDQTLHLWRYPVALRSLRGVPPAPRILFVCTGNICRSPYAAVAMRQARAWVSAVESAGFSGPGRRCPDTAVAVARARGIDLTHHVSSLLTQARVSAADLVVVMDAIHRRLLLQKFEVPGRVVLLGDLDPAPITGRAVRDPWDQPEEVFNATYARIDRCLAIMARALTES